MEQTEIIFYIHVSSAVFSGLIASFLNLDAITGFSLFIILYISVSQALGLLKIIDIKLLEKPGKLYTTGLVTSLVIFIVVWIISTNLILGIAPKVVLIQLTNKPGVEKITSENSAVKYVTVDGFKCNSYFIIKPYQKDLKSEEVYFGKLVKDIKKERYILLNEQLKEGIFFNVSDESIRPFKNFVVKENTDVQIPWVSGNYVFKVFSTHLVMGNNLVYFNNLGYSELPINFRGKTFFFTLKKEGQNASGINLTIYGPVLPEGNLSKNNTLNLSSLTPLILREKEGLFVAKPPKYVLKVNKPILLGEVYIVLSGIPSD